jgi:hypothetical protein
MLRGLTLQVVHHGPMFKIIKLIKKNIINVNSVRITFLLYVILIKQVSIKSLCQLSH